MSDRAELAPSPPGVEVCSCDESLALRVELAAARTRLERFEPSTLARQRAIAHAWDVEGGGDGSD